MCTSKLLYLFKGKKLKLRESQAKPQTQVCYVVVERVNMWVIKGNRVGSLLCVCKENCSAGGRALLMIRSD